MKRFWLFWLSMVLVGCFSVSAFAMDVKFKGEYYAAGMYLDKTDVKDSSDGNDPSTAFFYQRFRLGTDFVVSPALKLVTRVDIMERAWEPDSTSYYATTSDGKSYNGDAQNVDWDIAYIDFTSPIGLFQVGYMPDYVWGTVWGNRASGPTTGQIKYIVPVGPVKMVFAYAKEEENDYFVNHTSASYEDRDFDSYRVGPIFEFKNDKTSGEAGVLFVYNSVRQYRGLALTETTAPFKQNMYVLQPYFKAKFGPVAMQGEINYAMGERDFETDLVEDQDINSLTAWLDADAKFGMFSVGGSLAYVQGDDDPKEINDALTGGRDWDPCLIMYNNTPMNSWVGKIKGYNAATADNAWLGTVNGEMNNVIFGQVRASVTPVPQFTGAMSLSYAQADEDFGGDSDKGFEVDLTGTYKITDNLSYMLGFGYLKTGDYYKAGIEDNKIEDDYLVINKLTITF